VKWKSVEQRFPTKRARELADAAIDKLPLDAPMSRFVDEWLQTYEAAGGIDKAKER